MNRNSLSGWHISILVSVLIMLIFCAVHSDSVFVQYLAYILAGYIVLRLFAGSNNLKTSARKLLVGWIDEHVLVGLLLFALLTLCSTHTNLRFLQYFAYAPATYAVLHAVQNWVLPRRKRETAQNGLSDWYTTAALFLFALLLYCSVYTDAKFLKYIAFFPGFYVFLRCISPFLNHK